MPKPEPAGSKHPHRWPTSTSPLKRVLVNNAVRLHPSQAHQVSEALAEKRPKAMCPFTETRPEDIMMLDENPSLTEDLLYIVIRYRLKTDLYELCDNPTPHDFCKNLPTSYHVSVSSFSRVSKPMNSLVQRIVAEDFDRALAQRRGLYSRMQELCQFYTGSKDADSIPLRFCGQSPETRWLNQTIARADTALDRLALIQTALANSTPVAPQLVASPPDEKQIVKYDPVNKGKNKETAR